MIANPSPVQISSRILLLHVTNRVMNVIAAADAGHRSKPMKIFAIESETNNIMVHRTIKEAKAVADADIFRDEAGLVRLAADWPVARLVDIWNSLPGAAQVRKFKDRGTAVARIWKAIQNLGDAAGARSKEEFEPAGRLPVIAPQTPDVAAEAEPTQVNASHSKKRLKNAQTVRDGSKTSTMLDLLMQKNGATLAVLMEATGWQAHSVRGFLSGTIRKKMAINVQSAKGQDGQRRYYVMA